jgi:hypothetical protein
MSISRFHGVALGVIIAISALLYGHTLPFPFVFDDHTYLVDNPIVKDARSFIFMGDFCAFSTYSRRLGLDPDLSTNFILRPFARRALDMVPRGGRLLDRTLAAVARGPHAQHLALAVDLDLLLDLDFAHAKPGTQAIQGTRVGRRTEREGQGQNGQHEKQSSHDRFPFSSWS